MDLHSEYSKRKNEIENRLKDFKQLNEEDLFYELCFCLLTPQSKAKNADYCIKKMKENNFLEIGFNPTEILKQKIRFHNNKGKYLLEMREKYYELKKNLDKIKNNKEKRDFLVKNIKGIGLKEASLPYNEKVLVLINNKIKLVEIGELYDNYDQENEIKTFAFNHKTLKFNICPITKIMKHNYKKDMYEIKLVTGRKVSITGDHSVFTTKDSKLIESEVRNLNKGDYIAIPNSLKHPGLLPQKINIVKEYLDNGISDNIYLRSKSYSKYLRDNFQDRINRKNQYIQYFRGITPINVLKNLPEEAYSIRNLERYCVAIGIRKSNNILKSVIKLDEDFFWTLGILMAEASITKSPIEFTLGLEELDRHKKLNYLLNKIFGSNVKKYKPKNRNVYISKVHSKPFFYFIKEVLDIKGKATTKNFPEIVYSASYINIIAFLQGFWEGDGWKKSKSYMNISTTSTELANGILLCLLMVGVIGRHCIKKRDKTINHAIDVSGIIKPEDIKTISFINNTEVVPFLGHMLHEIHKELKIKSKINGEHTYLFNKIMRNKHINQPRKEELKKIILSLEKYGKSQKLEEIKKIVYSDLSFFEIKEIKKIKYDKKYVYDLEVSDKNNKYENFVGGFGGVCLHNSHFLRNTGHESLAILDRHILKNLVKAKAIEELPKTLTKKKYFEIEEKFMDFSYKIGIPMDHLDLLFWCLETGEVFK